jgi:tRNA threonylcarbamoyl adenosine modification protein (Sua5/YciO/YrdC/YwlC family)
VSGAPVLPPELAAAAEALRGGAVVAIPTDTVYGLAVDPTRPGATERLFALKARPDSAALPVLVADAAQAAELAGDGWSPPARALAARFWPGALTIVCRRRPDLDWELGGDASTVGLRAPAAELARRLCAAVGPLATTSANRHGRPPLETAAAVSGEFGPSLVVVDGGHCGGVPSTVVDVTVDPVRCLRAGGVDMAEVLAVVRA